LRPVDACFFQDPLDQSAIFEFTTPGQLDNHLPFPTGVDGVGVAIGLRPYVEDDLASGRLVAPFKLAVPKGQAWYLVYRPFRQDDAALVAFRDWLMANVERDPG
jgi:hypothetical protein